ncbi:MAG: ABC transporter substrate-binding protein, partial [Euzebyales bacterium]|nr:ABC transporter substrate-binding protein [Euzebyales bacterium]
GEPTSEGAGGAGAATETPGGDGGGTLVFGTSADPKTLDPPLASDGESLRVSEQLYEGLVSLEPGGTEPVPKLATSWKPSRDATSWTFQLQEGVSFHDGEPFNAEAVCFNFDRWYNFKGPLQLSSASYYWQVVFGGYAKTESDSGAPEESLYDSCEPVDDHTVTLNLTRPSAAFIAGLALPTFSFASPKALREFEADKVSLKDGNPAFLGSYGYEHPTGTGPFTFVDWKRDDRLTIERNDDYWGEPAKLDRIIFRPIADNGARLQALQSGEIDGYDLVEPQDVATIEADDNLQVVDRPPFNIAFLGINQAMKPMQDLAVRKALIHGLNREAVIEGLYGGRGELAKELMPPSVFGYAEDVPTYEFDPEKAKQLLTDAGYDLPVEIELWYPTDVTRPYLPDPQATFEAFSADLEQAGFKVKPRSAPWTPDYLDDTLGGKAQLYFMGQTGDFGDPDTFLGTFFREKRPMFGWEDPEIFGLLQDGLRESDKQARIALYEEANRKLMEQLPAIPFAHASPALAFKSTVQGFTPSPVTLESFAPVTIEGG